MISDYHVYLTKQGDGAISFRQDGISRKVIIPKSNTIAKEIFNRHYEELTTFKSRHYAIAKWIVRDLRKEGFVFKAYKKDIAIIKPIRLFRNNKFSLSYNLSKVKELDIVNRKIYCNSIENVYRSSNS